MQDEAKMEFCAECDDYGVCSGIPCAEHFLFDKMIKELNEAVVNGLLWGDMVVEEEAAYLATESDSAKKDRLKKMTLEKRKELDGLKAYVVGKTKSRSCEMVGGKHVLKLKMPKMCENVKEGDVVLPDGSTYKGGCWAHNEKCCPFMHPGEEKIYIFPDHRPLRLVNGEAPKIYTNAVYYSTKSEPKPVPAKPQSTFKDSW